MDDTIYYSLYMFILEYELYYIYILWDRSYIENSENDHSSWQVTGWWGTTKPVPTFAPHLQTFQERPGYLDLALTLW